jgi:hypothetical protein
VPSSEKVELFAADVDVLGVDDGVVGIRTVVCRSELQAVASAVVASSVSIGTVLFTMVFVLPLQFRNRAHESGAAKFPTDRIFRKKTRSDVTLLHPDGQRRAEPFYFRLIPGLEPFSVLLALAFTVLFRQ